MKTSLLFAILFLTLLGTSTASGNTETEGKTSLFFFLITNSRGYFTLWRKLVARVYSACRRRYLTCFSTLNCLRVASFCLLIFRVILVFIQISLSVLSLDIPLTDALS